MDDLSTKCATGQGRVQQGRFFGKGTGLEGSVDGDGGTELRV
jgi:hypothetical protein